MSCCFEGARTFHRVGQRIQETESFFYVLLLTSQCCLSSSCSEPSPSLPGSNGVRKAVKLCFLIYTYLQWFIKTPVLLRK
ncbi:hypothetical protein FKM82_013469 [Ascaphus truei]